MPATSPKAPAFSHNAPWAHEFICCDHDHSASSSRSPSPSGHQDCDECVSGGQDLICCDDTDCAEGIEGTRADHAGHMRQAVEPKAIDADHLHDQSCDLTELERWACTQEGCKAIQQYLECCTVPDCHEPPLGSQSRLNCGHPHDTPAHHHLVSVPHSAATAPAPNWHPLPHTINPSAFMTQLTSAPIAAAEPQPVLPTTVCHWQNCHRTFQSTSELLSHIANDHLTAPPAQVAFGAPQSSTGHQAAMQVYDAASVASSLLSGTSTPATTAPSTVDGLNMSQADAENLLSCLWDDCFPLPTDCSADPQEPCPTHPLNPQSDHNHVHAHTHPLPNNEPFSPQTMLRHVLEEHLGVPGDILGWNANTAVPLGLDMSAAAAQSLSHAHQSLHHHHHSHGHQGHKHRHHPYRAAGTQQPTPSPSSAILSTPSNGSPPPMSLGHRSSISAPSLVCLWPGCPIKKTFLTSAELMEHLAEEHVGKGRDSYVCQFGECAHHPGGGRVFRSRQKVLRHLQSHTGHKPYVCEQCGQAFSESAPLNAHMRRHAKEKPFKCEHPGCGKEFAISSSLTIHMRTHNGEKPFVCPHCDKGFVEASNLTKHIRTHTGERPFECTEPGCRKRFARPDQLKRHMGVHERAKEERAKEESGVKGVKTIKA